MTKPTPASPTLTWAAAIDPAELVRVLHDAEEDDARIAAALADPANATLSAWLGTELVGAAVIRWSEPASELLYLAVTEPGRGSGLGRALVDEVGAEHARRGGAGVLEVGTATAAVDNLAFYQRCGFRMHRIEPDHFAYIDPPVSEHGIVLRDRVVFRAASSPAEEEATAPLFCSVELAAEIERAEADLMAACAMAAGDDAIALALAGGWATAHRGDSPFTKVAGLGFDGPPTAADLDAAEAAFAEAGAQVVVELSNLADPAVLELLAARGYRLVGTEHVLGRTLPAPELAVAPQITVAPAADPDAWLDLDVRATLVDDEEGVASHESFDATPIEHALRLMLAAGSTPYLATLDGQPAGAGSMRLAGRIAQLNGASTLPEHRRRGVQRSLLAARLRTAADAGCELAVVTTRPGSPSQRNVQRAGFTLLYGRSILVGPS